MSDSDNSFESSSSSDEDVEDEDFNPSKKATKKKPPAKKAPAKSKSKPKTRAKTKPKSKKEDETEKENEPENMKVEDESKQEKPKPKGKSKSRAKTAPKTTKKATNTTAPAPKSKAKGKSKGKGKKKDAENEEENNEVENIDDEEVEEKDPYAMDSFDQDKEINDIYAQKENKLECTAVEEIIDPNYFIEPLIVYDKFKLAKIPDTNPMDIFNKFFTNEFFKYICDQTNSYSIENNLSKDKSISTEDIKNYFFILIYVSVIKLPQIDMLWTKSEFYSTIVPKVMTLYKFKKITQYFHVGAVGGADPMSKLNLIIIRHLLHPYLIFSTNFLFYILFQK